MASSPITSQQTDGAKVETMIDFIFLGSRLIVDDDCSHEIKRCLLLGRKAITNPDSVFKKQRHHFTNKGLYSQSYGFPSSHIQMWELDHQEGWMPKNWHFWTVVLEKTESPLDHKEIKSVHLKGNQPWILIGWTDVEAEAPILWRLTWRVNTSEKTLMLLKTESKRRGWQKMNKFDGITDAMYMSLSKLQEIVNDKES